MTSQPVWKGLYALIVAGLLLRIAYVFAADNLHHPDEVFQYLEQAHRLVFGYGQIPWEYRFGIRSWLLPFVIVPILYICKLLQLDNPADYIPVVRIVFCVLATSVIPSCYVIARSLAGERAGRMAAVITCIWYELIFFAARPLTEVVAAYVLLAAFALALSHRRKCAFVLGMMLAIGFALRPLYATLLPFIGLTVLRWGRRSVLLAAGAFAMVMVAVGALDLFTWGGWFVSYYNNYVFNGELAVSNLFGIEPAYWYVQMLAITSAGIFMLAYIVSLRWARKLWLPIAAVTLVVGMHSLIPHKEYRHIFVVIPLLVTLFACTVALATEGLRHGRRITGFALLVLAVISTYGMRAELPMQREAYRSWSLFASAPLLQAYQHLHDDPSVRSVNNAVAWWWAGGGYYYLHKQVPLYNNGDVNSMAAYVSHHIVSRNGECPIGFVQDVAIEWLQICKRSVPLKPDFVMPPYDTIVTQPGVDGVFEPTVKPRF